MKITPVSKNRDFRRIYAKGKSFVFPEAVVYYMKNRRRITRVGVTSSKKVGNAVLRNRARRKLRAAVYTFFDEIRPGFDIILVARGKTPFVKSGVIADKLSKGFKTAGLLNVKENVKE